MLKESVYSRLREDILTRVVAPDEILTEIALTQRYGASRTPVREALQRLEQDGLVERRGKVLMVRSHTPEEIVDIYESRIVLEQAAASKAALKRSNLDLIMLRSRLGEMQVLDPTDGPSLAEANRSFHTSIWTSTHSPSLIRLLESLDQQVRRYPLTTLTYPGRWKIVLTDYESIIGSIEIGDGHSAGALAAKHMSEALEIRLKMYATNPGVL